MAEKFRRPQIRTSAKPNSNTSLHTWLTARRVVAAPIVVNPKSATTVINK